MRFLKFPDQSFYQMLNECIADMEVTEFSISDVLALYIVAASLSYFRPFRKMSPALEADTFLFTAYIAHLFALQNTGDDKKVFIAEMKLIDAEFVSHIFPRIKKFIRNRYAKRAPFPDAFVVNRIDIFNQWFSKSIEMFFRAMIFLIHNDLKEKDFPLYFDAALLRENTWYFKAMLREVHSYYFQLQITLREVVKDFVAQTINQ